MNCITLGGADVKEKPRIGCISHPVDVSLCLDAFCSDVFRIYPPAGRSVAEVLGRGSIG